MNGLLLALHGPLQAWGTGSLLGDRGTGPVPTTSGVLGMVRAAAGDARGADGSLMATLLGLDLLVRVDRPGLVERDYHTVTQGAMQAKGVRHGSTIVSTRWYLADAAFVVALVGPTELVDTVHGVLRAPVWHYGLGRRSCLPAFPLVLGPTDDVLGAFEFLPLLRPGDDTSPVSVETPSEMKVDRAGWTGPSRQSAPRTRPVPGSPRQYTAEGRSWFDMTTVHAGTSATPYELAEAARGL